MLPRDHACLLDILEQIRFIQVHMEGLTYDEFLEDHLRQAALRSWLEIIGEAATRLSDAFRQAHPEVEWNKYRHTRNLLIHVYDRVNYPQIWRLVTQDLAPLQLSIEAIIKANTTGSESKGT